MISELEVISFFDVEDVEKGVVMCNEDDMADAILVIKQWVAHILSNHYDGDPKKMMEAKKHVLTFVKCSWLNKIVLISNK